MKVFLSTQIIQAVLLCSMLILGYSCTQENNKEISVKKTEDVINDYEEKIANKAIRDSVPMDDPVNVIIKSNELKIELNNFIDTLYIQKWIIQEVRGVTIMIMKNTENDFALKLIYASPECSDYLLGLTDYKYKDLFVYLLTKAGQNDVFFELKYQGICEKLKDYSTLINKTHYIQYYEMLRNIPEKILYYQKKDGEFVLTNIFYNDFDVPGIRSR
jgi:hypothetical protein